MHRRVALIAYSLRFPGTDNQHLWADLLAKKDLITEVDASRWAKSSYLHPDKRHPGSSYTFAAGSLGDVSGFDAAFFGISPREATQIDPQQRLLLELAWETFENAGIVPSSLRGSDCGVYIGISSADYVLRMSEEMTVIDSATATGTLFSIAANRISYFFDLHGPSIAMDTACSSSLVAFHQACQAIASGEISQALTGGINLHLHPYGFISFSKATMLSKTGRCHTFDADGDGYVRSEGGGLFFLKDYEQAVADGDPILAVVAGSGVNTDGHKSGLTIPNHHAQAELITRVYQQAGISPDEIDYFEAHGTGTAVGDPIESHSIGLALGTKRQQPLLIGSIKSNIGHLESASGVAGLAKALNCLQHRAIPATINIKNFNPNIKFADWNLRVVTETEPLKAKGDLTIGINSFGFGGANAHVILKSHSAKPVSSRKKASVKNPTSLPLVISGKDSAALKQAALAMADCLEQTADTSFYDIAYSAFFNRERHSQAALLFSSSATSAADQLRLFGNPDADSPSKSVHLGTALAQASGPVFVYSGNGCQWQAMGQQLLAESPVFQQAIADVDQLFSQYSDLSLLALLSEQHLSDPYAATEIAQPALFALQVGITKVLAAQGITPVAVIGHSVGEVAAAWASGALSLPAAVKVIYYRSHHQGKTKGSGGMAAVGLNANDAASLLEKPAYNRLALAGVNSHRGVTIAGDVEQLTTLEATLSANNTFFKRLPLDYAFHSPAMDSLEAGIRKDLQDLTVSKPALPFFSTVTGKEVTDKSLSAEYWWLNIRQPVRFEEATQNLLAKGFNTLVEIGSHPILQSYLNDGLKNTERTGLVINTLSKTSAGIAKLDTSIAQLMLSGCAFNQSHWFPHKGNFVQLPNYPWQREKFWHTTSSEATSQINNGKIHPLLGHALPQHLYQWENQLDTQLEPYLTDHNVGGTILFPAAGFAEVAIAAAYQIDSRAFVELEELEIRSPLVLSHEQTKIIRFSYSQDDGRFTLNSRELAHASNWQSHSAGRILSDATGTKLTSANLVLPERQADFDQASHAALTDFFNFKYGPAFQTIDYGWLEGTQAICQLRIPDSIKTDVAEYFLHPAFLDGTFQLVFQILQQFLSHHDDIVFVPTKIGRLHIRSDKALPTYAKANLLHLSEHALKAEFALYDADGAAIAVLSDCRFRAVRLHKKQQQHLSYLDYHLTAAPLNSHYAPTLDNALFRQLSNNSDTPQYSRYCAEMEPLLDSLCHQSFIEYLSKHCDDKGFIAASRLQALASQHANNALALTNLLALAENYQTVTAIDDLGWQLDLSALTTDISATAIWNTLVQEYPDYFYLSQLVGRLHIHWQALFTSPEQAANLGINESLYAKIYSYLFEHTAKTDFTVALQQQLQAFIANLPTGERLRILEIGASKSEFASLVCQQLDLHIADYCFASDNDDALNTLASLQEQLPLLQTLRLPSDNQPVPTTTKANFAIINLNFGSIESIQRLLQQLPELIAANAPVLFIGLHPARWLDGLMGFSDNWWLASQRSMQLPMSALQEQLTNQNFSAVESIEFMPGYNSGHYLLTANFPSTAPNQAQPAGENWLIIADQALETEAHAAKLLAEQLSDQHQQVSIAPTLTDASRYQHIVHLSGFGMNDDRLQSHRCWLASQISQALEMTASDATVWLLTQNVASLMRCDQNLSLSAAEIAHDAALWGFGRTLMNEATSYRVRLLDINGDLQYQQFAAAVLAELLSSKLPSSNEQEAILTATGQRFAPRLRIQAALSNPPADTDSPAAALKLGFKMPGQLRNLTWQKIPVIAPAADEIAIEVKATGLNFRDVMYTLGMLSDEAIEAGFAGATLGLEFAGVICQLGAKVTGFKLGDAVVGFGSACFSSRLLVKAETVTLIPNNISFAAAATIPSTFFTVFYALHHLARLQAGEKVLIHGAAGGVGIAAIQVARWLGAEIYATVGSEDKRDFLTLLGIEHIHDSRSLRFAEEILAQTDNRGVDVVLNSLAGEAINRNLQVLKPFGRFLELGKRDFYENTAIGLRPFRNNISYFGIDADQLLSERPDLSQKLFMEMMQLFHEGVFYPLPYTTFEANHVVDAFRHMQQAKQIGKIVVTYPYDIQTKQAAAKASTLSALQLSDDGSYLVSGGLAGFGLRSAQWLVEKGARHLILIGRSGANNDEAQAALAQWALEGVDVYAAACDVSDQQALALLLTECQTHMPPLKGVIHAAAVIEDSLISNLSEDQIQRVLQPKIQGAMALHELTEKLPLDFFILYSSVTTLFGNPGQSHYVAANLWLEALAAYRNNVGLPATCIRWGAIDDVGYLARNQKIKESLQNRMGGSTLTSALALSVLETLLQEKPATLGVMEFDWRSLSTFLSSARSGKFSEIAKSNQSSDHNDDISADIKKLLAELSDEDLHAVFVDMLKEELSQILLVNKDKINAEQSMYDIGLDSLMGVELMVAIESRFSVQIPVLALSEAPTLNKLANRLIVLTRGDNLSEDAATESNANLIASVSELSSRHDTNATREEVLAFVEEFVANKPK